MAAGENISRTVGITGDGNSSVNLSLGLDKRERGADDSMIVSAINQMMESLERVNALLSTLTVEVKLMQDGGRRDMKQVENELIHLKTEIAVICKRVEELDAHRRMWMAIVSISLIGLGATVAYQIVQML